MHVTTPPPPDFLQTIPELLHTWGAPLPSGWDTLQIVREARKQHAASTGTFLLEKALTQLQEHHPAQARLLHLRYREALPVKLLMQRLHRSRASLHRDFRAAYEALGQILWDWEQTARARFYHMQSQRLEPAPYDQLFGVEGLLQQVQQQVMDPQGPRILLITGMGGIGKTSLAHALSMHLIQERRYLQFGWVSLRPQVSLWDPRPYVQIQDPQYALEQLFERLARQLAHDAIIPAPFSLEKLLARLDALWLQEPPFIVLDNLETLPDLTPLLTQLQSLRAPARFLLTSRQTLSFPSLYVLPLPPLDSRAARALLRHEGRKRNIPILQQAEDAVLDKLHHAAGGNPLALRLLAGQLHTLDLTTVLENLAQAQSPHVARLFDYLYHWAWETLSERERRVFLAMPLLPPEGGEAAHLAAITELPVAHVHEALETLVSMNLVQASPGLERTHYAIHSLTRAFLQSIAQWS